MKTHLIFCLIIFVSIFTGVSYAEEAGDDDAVEFAPLYYTVYRVRKGDMIDFIADKFNVSADSITSINKITNTRRIQIGQYLKIPSMSGILYTVKTDSETFETVAEKYKKDGVSAEKCAASNNLPLASPLSAGQTIFVPDASLDWVTRQEINGDLFSRPLRCRYYISSRFGYRKSPFTGKPSYHNGVDMACNAGNKIYAAMGGVVTTAGWNDVYGNYAIVSHHSGYKTLYAHMSKIHDLTKVGRVVSTDSVIGYVGTTGLSTGNHLHFSVFKNGKAVNPQNLWR